MHIEFGKHLKLLYKAYKNTAKVENPLYIFPACIWFPTVYNKTCRMNKYSSLPRGGGHQDIKRGKRHEKVQV